jgi:hypothetical protein
LLSGPPATDVGETEPAAPARTDRIGVLEGEVARLRAEVEDLKREFAGFRKQFE